MPRWFKQAVFILIGLVALANFREIGEGLAQFADGLAGLFQWNVFHYRDPNIRFAVFGLLLFIIFAMWTIYWQHHGKSDD